MDMAWLAEFATWVLAGSFNPAALDQACAELEDLRKQLGDTEEDKPMSMNQLAVNLLRHAQPEQFEQQFLGWAALPNPSVTPQGRKRDRSALGESGEPEVLE